MTYNDIVTRIVRRLGWKGYDNSLKSDLKLAIEEAESELLMLTEPAYRTVVIDIVSATAEYLLSSKSVTEFHRPHEIGVYTTDNVKLAHEEVTYDQWLRWDPTETSDQVANDALPANRSMVDVQANTEFAKFQNKVLIAIHYRNVSGGGSGDTASGHYISVKPAMAGKIVLHYSTLTDTDVFNNLTKSPDMPDKFHQYIVAGAVFRMAQIEAAKYVGTDANKVAFFQRVEANAYAEWKVAIDKVQENRGLMSVPIIARPYQMYRDTDRKITR